MGKSIKVNLGPLSFPKKGDATAHFRAMLKRYAVGERLSNEDSAALVELFRYHDDYEHKKGEGISHFEVMISDMFESHCFRVVRKDGSGTDFSYHACLANIR